MAPLTLRGLPEREASREASLLPQWLESSFQEFHDVIALDTDLDPGTTDDSYSRDTCSSRRVPAWSAERWVS